MSIATHQTIEQNIHTLRADIARHCHLYHSLDAPEISNAEFNAALLELERLEAAAPHLITSDSPTQRVGSAPRKGFNLLHHTAPMLSLTKIADRDSFSVFDTAVRHMLGKQTEIDYIAELKIDGLAVNLRYEFGRLVSAALRGDGVAGEDVTANARTLMSIPKELSGTHHPDFFEVRGEVYITKTDLAGLNARRVAARLKPYQTPQSAASASLRRIDANHTAQCSLRFAAYDIGAARRAKLPGRHSEIMHKLNAWGFSLPQNMQALSCINDADTYFTNNAGADIPADGIVIKIDRLDQQRIAGSTATAPRWAIAKLFS